MAKIRYAKTQILEKQQETKTAFADKPVAIYYRQSTQGQVGNVSTAMQKEDLPALAVRMGWKPENVILIDTDEGISGAKTIDERPGMTRLFSLIVDNQIGTVLVQDESRLFRDQTMIQPNIFIDACKTNQVTVIADGITYQFHDPISGSMHARIFRFKAEAAADFLQSQIMKMQGARTRNLKQGMWVGGRVPLGYIVGPDARYVAFEPIAEVIRQWFKLFVEKFEGNVNATAIYIRDNGPHIPDLDSQDIVSQIPKDHHLDKLIYRRGEERRGFLSGNGLAQILTNPTCIGMYYAKGQYIPNNHPAILSEGLFYAAFNYISDRLLDGTPNPNYNPRRIHRDPVAEADRSVPRPLCEGLIYGFNTDGEIVPVYTSYMEDDKGYKYLCVNLKQKSSLGRETLWMRDAALVDRAAVALLRIRLLATPITTILKNDTQVVAALQARHDLIKKQRDIADKKAQTTVKNAALADGTDMFRLLQDEYNGYCAEVARLDKIASQLLDEIEQQQHAKQIIEEIGYYAVNWNDLSRDQKRKAVKFCIQRIEVNADEDSELDVKVFWSDGTTERIAVPASARSWLKSEAAALMRMVDTGATQIEIMNRLYKYNWRSIQEFYARHTGTRLAIKSDGARKKETIMDYWHRTRDARVNLGPILFATVMANNNTGNSQEAREDTSQNLVETKFVSIALGDTTPTQPFNVGNWAANQATGSADKTK
jgi:DNA invertase Pin-like site-specific DNA recombinase